VVADLKVVEEPVYFAIAFSYFSDCAWQIRPSVLAHGIVLALAPV
jgi:hypothetical protein